MMKAWIDAISLVLSLLGLVIELFKQFWPILKRAPESKTVSMFLASNPLPAGTPAREIALLLTTLSDERLIAGDSEYQPLVDIHNDLWQIRLRVKRLAEKAVAERRVDDLHTLEAMERVVGVERTEACSFLRSICEDLHTPNNVRDEAVRWMTTLGCPP